MYKKSVIFFFIAAFTTTGLAQERSLVPEGMFLKDSLGVGEHIMYSLKYSYPREMDLIFPDSNYNFFPFEYVSKKFFSTKVDSTFLTDSVVYTLTTFEIDPVLYLSTPVFVLQNGDSTKYFSNIDSAYFHQLIDTLPDEPKMNSNTNFAEVAKDFNYIYFLIAGSVFLLIVVFTAILFGNKIVNWIKIKRLEKAHKRFHKNHSRLLRNLSSPTDKAGIGALLIHWKKYMEKLEKRPFTKLTTKEITIIYDDGELNGSLREIDKALYGDYITRENTALFGKLIEFSNLRLNLKTDELKNG